MTTNNSHFPFPLGSTCYDECGNSIFIIGTNPRNRTYPVVGTDESGKISTYTETGVYDIDEQISKFNLVIPERKFQESIETEEDKINRKKFYRDLYEHFKQKFENESEN